MRIFSNGASIGRSTHTGGGAPLLDPSNRSPWQMGGVNQHVDLLTSLDVQTCRGSERDFDAAAAYFSGWEQ